MAYLAVDKDGTEVIFSGEPQRGYNNKWNNRFSNVELPNGFIEKLIGRKLTWEDDPVELK